MEQERGAPVRVVSVEIPSPALSEKLLGPDVHAARCQVIFRYMLPLPESATLQAVTGHGLVLVFSGADSDGEQHGGLLVPWSQLSYVKFPFGAPTSGENVP
jgi:hypothetical protein